MSGAIKVKSLVPQLRNSGTARAKLSVPVGVMFVLLLQPYAPQLSMGGGGGGNDRGWRDLDDDEKDKYRFHISFTPSHSKKPQVKRK